MKTIKKFRTRFYSVIAFGMFAIFLSCKGPAGPAGPQGPSGGGISTSAGQFTWSATRDTSQNLIITATVNDILPGNGTVIQCFISGQPEPTTIFESTLGSPCTSVNGSCVLTETIACDNIPSTIGSSLTVSCGLAASPFVPSFSLTPLTLTIVLLACN